MTTYLIDYENTSHHGLEGFRQVQPSDTVVIFLGAKSGTAAVPIDTVRELTAPGERPRLLWKRSRKTSKNYLDLQLVSYLGSLIGDSTITETSYVIVSKDRDFEAAIDFWADRRKDIRIVRRATISPSPKTPAPEPAPIVIERSTAPAAVKHTATPAAATAATAEGSTATAQTASRARSPEATAQPASKAATPPDTPPTTAPARPVPEATKRAVRAAVKPLGLKPSDYSAIYRSFEAARNPQDLHTKLCQAIKPHGQKVFPLVRSIFASL